MKNILFIFVAILAFSGSGLITHFYYRTDNLSLRYNLWKVGLWPRPDHLAGALLADKQGENVIRGMTKDEIRELFPAAHEEPANEYQRRYEKWDIKGRDHLWLNDWELIVFFEDGRAQGISLMKG
jgi:hypothetical protein